MMPEERKAQVVLVDDEPLACQLLREHLNEYEALEVMAERHNGREALAFIEARSPDLVFLDVQMPGWDGFDVLKRLSLRPHIIFVTAHDEFAVRAFEAGAVDYLLKPYSQNRLAKAIGRFLRQWQSGGLDPGYYDDLLQIVDRHDQEFADHLLVRVNDTIVPVRTEHIVYIRAAGDYVKIHTENGTYLASAGIGEMERRLDHARFVRVHRSAIIALQALEELVSEGDGGYQARMTNGKSVRVSRSYGRKLRERMV